MTDLIETMARAMSRRIMLEESGISLAQTLDASLAVDRAVDRHWTDCTKDIRAVLLAIDGADYVIVPKKLTLNMYDAGSACIYDGCAADAWRAMIAAAPKVSADATTADPNRRLPPSKPPIPR